MLPPPEVDEKAVRRLVKASAKVRSAILHDKYYLSSQPEGSGVQTLHIYELVAGVLKQLLGGGETRFWEAVVEHLVRVEFQGRGTLHFHLALWVIPKGRVEDFEHGRKRGRSSDLGEYLAELFHSDVDIRTGSGFLNYINGYVSKSSDCVDFSAKEYSSNDSEGAENTDWKRTYRALQNGSPCVQEICCALSRHVELMSRSASVVEAFPPVPFEEPRENDTAVAYAAFHRLLGPGPVGSFLSWLRTVKKISSAGLTVQYREQQESTLAVGVRYRGVSGDGFLGQLCTMLMPHAGPEAFVGGPGGAAMLPYLKGCRCLVGALVYLGSLWRDVGGLRSDFYPDALLDLDDFPRCAPVADLAVLVGSYVFGQGSLADRAFAGDCEDYLLRVVAQHMRFAGDHEDRVRTQRGRLLAALLLSRKAVRASPADFASLQHKWDTVVRGKSFGDAPEWSPDQVRFFDFIREQHGIECEWDLGANVERRRVFLSGAPGTGKSEVLVHAAKLLVDLGARVLFLAPTGALVHSYLDRLPDSESIFVDTVHAALRFSRQRDRELVKCNPPSRLQLFDAIFLDEVSMLPEDVFEHLWYHVLELPKRPIFVVAGDFAQLEAVDRNVLVQTVCRMLPSQFELVTVHRSKDPKHLAFVSAIRESQPSRDLIRDYFDFGQQSSRFLTSDRSLDEWVEFGMQQQQLHSHPFVWICNTNKGVAKVSLAALRGLDIGAEEIERDGFPGDPAVKCSLPIIPRPGVWIRLTRNLDKPRGFVNGALGRIEEVFRHDDEACIFSLRLLSGTMVMVYPVSFQRRTFLPAVYGYGCTVRRTQGLSLWHGAVYFDGRVWPRPRGHAYVAVSRFRRALGVFHYGPLRRSDWLPTDECEDEHVRPGEDSPADWDSESEESEDEFGGFGAHYRDAMGGDDSDGDEDLGGFGAHYRESMGVMAGGSDSESEEGEDGEEGGISRPDGEGDEEESLDDDMACRLSDLAPDSEPEDLAAAEHRCASPQPLPVVAPPDLDAEGFEEASPDAVAAGSAEPDEAEEGGEEEDPVVDLAVSDSSSEGFADLDAVPGCASPAPLLASSAPSLAAAVRPGVSRRAEGPSAVPAPLRKCLRLGAVSGGAPGSGDEEFGDFGGSLLGLSVGIGSGLASGVSRPSRLLAGDRPASGLASSSQPPETRGSSARSGSPEVKRIRVS